MQRQIQLSEQKFFPHSGHVSMIDDAGMMNDVVADFLGRVEAAQRGDETSLFVTRIWEEEKEDACLIAAHPVNGDIDVLIVEQMGKEISGAGLDPNITGRNCRGVTGFDKPRVEKIVLLDLTDMTHGNATGLGVADVITKRLLDRIDLGITYANVIASAYLDGGYIPIVMPTEKDAISLAVKTTPRVKPLDSRIVRIRDTLHLSDIEVSDALMAQVKAHPNLTAL